MSKTCMVLLAAFWSSICLSAQSSQTAQTLGQASPQQQLQQVQLQRVANQRLMLDAALDVAESFTKASFAANDATGVDSGESLTRLVEISNEIKAAARNDDGTGAANLAVEAGRILGWQITTAVNDTAEHLDSVVNLVVSYPLNLIASAQAYIRFAKFDVEDERLAQRAQQLSTSAAKEAAKPGSGSAPQSARTQIQQCSAAWTSCSAGCRQPWTATTYGGTMAEIHAANRCVAACNSASDACRANVKR